MKKRGLLLVLALLMLTVVMLTACGDEHEHTFSDTWTIDNDYHWHKATCEHTDAIAAKGGHVDADADGACDMCGNGEVHMHTYTDAWTSDANGHWHMATCDGHTTVKGDVYPHKNTDGNGTCDLCGYEVAYGIAITAPEGVTVADTVWVDKTTGAATFTASASTHVILSIEGATQQGEPVVANGVATYTYAVSGVTANGTATISQKRIVFGETVATGAEEDVEFIAPFYWAYAVLEDTVTLEPGYYAISATSTVEGWADISLNGRYADYDTGLFEVTEAGEYTLRISISGDAGNFTDIAYTVARAYDTEVTLDSLSGDGIIFPAGANMTLTFTVEEDGLYYFTSEVEDLVWDDNIGLVTKYAEAGDTIEIPVKAPAADGVYEFVWNVKKLESTGTVALGTNNVTINYRDFTVVTFTADRAGDYTFAATNSSTDVKEFDSTYGYMMGLWEAKTMAAGESVTLYIYNTDDTAYDGADSIEDVLTITYDSGNPSFTVTTTDTYTMYNHDSYTFECTESGTYTFYIPAGLGVMVDGAMEPVVDYNNNSEGYTWEVAIAEGYELKFWYSAATNAEWTIEYTFVAGEVTVSAGSLPATPNVITAGTAAVGTANMADTMSGVEWTFTAGAAGDYTLAYTNVNYILNGTSPMGATFTATAGQTFTLLVYPMAAGEYTITITAPAGGSGSGIDTSGNTLVVDGNGRSQVEGATVSYQYTAAENGTLTVTPGDGVVATVTYTATINGTDYTLNAVGEANTITLNAGDTFIITATTSGGYSTITSSWTAA